MTSYILIRTGFTENWVCDWKFDEKKFPKVEEMIEKLHQDGYKLSLWQLPILNGERPPMRVYDEAAANGYFAGNPDGDLQFPHGLIDFTNPEAVHWYKEKLIKPLLRKGVDVIKVDFGESAPAFLSMQVPTAGTCITCMPCCTIRPHTRPLRRNLGKIRPSYGPEAPGPAPRNIRFTGAVMRERILEALQAPLKAV